MPGGLHPHAYADSSLLQFSVEPLGFSIAVIQLLLSVLTRFLIHKSNFLKARVIIYSYNDHRWLLAPEPLVVDKPQSTRDEGASIVMESYKVMLHFSGYRCELNRSMQPPVISG